MGFCLLGCVARGQYFVGIDPHNKIDDLIRGNFAEPVRRVWWNDHHVPGADLAADAILNGAAAGAGAVEHGDDGVIGGGLSWIVPRPARYKRSVPLNDVGDLRGLVVVDAAAGGFFPGVFSVVDPDADVIFSVVL